MRQKPQSRIRVLLCSLARVSAVLPRGLTQPASARGLALAQPCDSDTAPWRRRAEAAGSSRRLLDRGGGHNAPGPSGPGGPAASSRLRLSRTLLCCARRRRRPESQRWASPRHAGGLLRVPAGPLPPALESQLRVGGGTPAPHRFSVGNAPALGRAGQLEGRTCVRAVTARLSAAVGLGQFSSAAVLVSHGQPA